MVYFFKVDKKLKIFKIKPFNKWAKKSGLSDESLRNAVNEIEQGLIDANLGGNLYKKRVAASTGGKRGGFRTLLAYKKGKDVFFLFGFEKNEKDNIDLKEEKALKELTQIYHGFSKKELNIALESGEIIEVKNE